MTTDVHTRFSQRPWPASSGENPNHTRERRGAMRQVLERYVQGFALLHERDMKELGTKQQLAHMRGYWEFRSQGRMTETRLFGFFPRKGAFIATDFQPRNIYETQADWDDQRKKCEGVWQGVTGGAPYLTSPWPVSSRQLFQVYLDHEDV